mmetsp:Transcript_52404/g.147047  ORF Transcript_52404/g.147047 Transcript_52404/m.147047 type:complete len:285 (+) Transcript_52404:3-857(+)
MSSQRVWNVLHDPCDELAWPAAELPKAKGRPNTAGRTQRLKAASEWAQLTRMEADAHQMSRMRMASARRAKAVEMKETLQAQSREKAYMEAVRDERSRMETAKAAREAEERYAIRDAEEAAKREEHRKAAAQNQKHHREQMREKQLAQQARADPQMNAMMRQQMSRRCQAVGAQEAASRSEQRQRKKENAEFVRGQVMEKAQRYDLERRQERDLAKSVSADAEQARQKQRQEASDRKAQAEDYRQALLAQMAERNQRQYSELMQGMDPRERAMNCDLLYGGCVR